MTWLETDWYRAGAVAAVLLLALVPVWLHVGSTTLVIVYLQLPLYMIHQVEEHRGDAFRTFFNLRIASGRDALTPRAVLVINVLGVWLVDIVVIYMAAFVDLSWGSFAVALAIVNGIVHIGAAIILRRYNPGLITGVVLFLGLGGWSLAMISAASDIQPAILISAFLFAIATHLAILVHVRRRISSLEGGASIAPDLPRGTT